MNYPDFKVCCRCFTFNHSKYVLDTLQGFVTQQTNFPFVCCIVDDASPDGEPEILRKYMFENFDMQSSNAFVEQREYGEVIYGQHKQNKNCYFAVLLLRENHYGKKSKLPYLAEWRDKCTYEAPCEGDDYWIDANKLQKQYDLIESHPDAMLCFHSIKEIYEGRPQLNKIRKQVENREYTGIEWYITRPAQFASFFFRLSIYDSEFYKQVRANKGFIAGDIPLLLSCAHYGKLYGISDVMSVYRHNETGWTSQKRSDEQIWKIINSQLEYKMFGKEYEKAAEYFAQKDCINAFLMFIKKADFRAFDFLFNSINISFTGTLKALIRRFSNRVD